MFLRFCACKAWNRAISMQTLVVSSTSAFPGKDSSGPRRSLPDKLTWPVAYHFSSNTSYTCVCIRVCFAGRALPFVSTYSGNLNILRKNKYNFDIQNYCLTRFCVFAILHFLKNWSHWETHMFPLTVSTFRSMHVIGFHVFPLWGSMFSLFIPTTW